MIRGRAYIPNKEVTAVSVENLLYTGDKRLIIGPRMESEQLLPVLDTSKLKKLCNYLDTSAFSVRPPDSLNWSFLRKTKVLDLKKDLPELSHTSLKGNIIVRSDTVLVIDSTAKLNHMIVFAKGIVVKSGFKGSCQLFAQDSITVGSRCRFGYPSALGVLRIREKQKGSSPQISIGGRSVINGILFIYEGKPTDVPSRIALAERDTLNGMVYSPEILQISDGDALNGCTLTGRFLYKKGSQLYENYLINTRLDQNGLSPYYLNSMILPMTSKKSKVLQWLEKK
jgi:hypothetical protein